MQVVTTSLGTSNITIMHNTLVQHRRSNAIAMKNNSSQQFNNIFIDHPVPPNTIVTKFKYINAGDSLEEAIESCIKLINEDDEYKAILQYSKAQ